MLVAGLLVEVTFAFLGLFPAAQINVRVDRVSPDRLRIVIPTEKADHELITAARAPPAGTRRIVVAGDSTIYGSFVREASTIPRMLEVLLSRGSRVPWEALNLGRDGLAAVDVCALGEAALEHLSPDVLVVYTGHNEFLPPHVAPFIDANLHPLRSALARRIAWSRIGRALAGRLVPQFAPDEPWRRSGYWSGVIERSIVAPARPRVLESFQRHLEQLARKAAERGMPLILAGPASNGREYGPLGSALSRPLSATELERFVGLLREAVTAFHSDRLEDCEESLESARAIDPQVAELLHLRAALAWARGEEAAARMLDLGKWGLDESARASSSDVIARIEAVARTTGSRFVELGPLLERMPRPGEPRLFLDNVHPSVYGQFLMARALAPEAARASGLPDGGPWLEFGEVCAALGISPEYLAWSESFTVLGDVNYACLAFDPEPYKVRARAALATLGEEQRSLVRFRVAEILLAILDGQAERAIELARAETVAGGGSLGWFLPVARNYPRIRAALERTGLELLAAEPWLRRVE
ncbi:MAG TPA: hypothetical protein VMT18_02195 [Planctomycetota bacterium]|nr:hypothetical protein [Planctomycetota bacterium]